MKVPRPFRPYLVGGPQEDGRRAGNEDPPGILAMIAAWRERERQLIGGAMHLRQEHI
jgi:cysteine desulfurase